MKSNDASRRSFLKNAAALTAAVSLPTLLTHTATGANLAPKPVAASDKVNLACCGIGNQGGSDVNSFFRTGLCNIVALCDVDMGAPHTQEILKKFPDVPRFQDFRVMMDKMGSQIDAVTAGVPDFAHFPIVMLAMSMGKHIFTEKPMGRTFNEVELMIQGAK
jgi:predicted dehydrogenase